MEHVARPAAESTTDAPPPSTKKPKKVPRRKMPPPPDPFEMTGVCDDGSLVVRLLDELDAGLGSIVAGVEPGVELTGPQYELLCALGRKAKAARTRTPKMTADETGAFKVLLAAQQRADDLLVELVDLTVNVASKPVTIGQVTPAMELVRGLQCDLGEMREYLQE